MEEKDFSGIFNIAEKWRSLVAMIKDKGYKIPLVRKLLYLAFLVYIVSPIDFIPELLLPILPVGLIDDVGALAFFITLLLYEIGKYEDYLALGGAGGENVGSTKVKVEDKGKTVDLDKEEWKTK